MLKRRLIWVRICPHVTTLLTCLTKNIWKLNCQEVLLFFWRRLSKEEEAGPWRLREKERRKEERISSVSENILGSKCLPCFRQDPFKAFAVLSFWPCVTMRFNCKAFIKPNQNVGNYLCLKLSRGIFLKFRKHTKCVPFSSSSSGFEWI